MAAMKKEKVASKGSPAAKKSSRDSGSTKPRSGNRLSRSPSAKQNQAGPAASASKASAVKPPGSSTGFPIVGIGASAGGLEALEKLFDNMPTDTGMAFVVVTHQHPGHTRLLPQLLSKESEMPVVEAADGTKLERLYPSRSYNRPMTCWPATATVNRSATYSQCASVGKSGEGPPVLLTLSVLSDEQGRTGVIVMSTRQTNE